MQIPSKKSCYNQTVLMYHLTPNRGLFFVQMFVALLVISYRTKKNEWKYIPLLLLLAVVFFFTDQFMAAIGWMIELMLDAIIWVTEALSDLLVNYVES